MKILLDEVLVFNWIPACAGMTEKVKAGMTEKEAGMTNREDRMTKEGQE